MATELTLANDINNLRKLEPNEFLIASGITVTDCNVSQRRVLANKTANMKLQVILEKDVGVNSFFKRMTFNL